VPQSYIHKKILENIKPFNLFNFERKITNFNNPKKILNIIRTDLDRVKTRKILFDGFGTKRLAKYITKNYDSAKLTNYSNKDLYFLFNLVNQTDVRRSSFNSKEITFESHQKWIKNFMNKKSNKILIFKYKHLKIRPVRLEKKNNFYILDYSISNEFRGMNYGSKMLKLLIKNYKINNISASVKSNNISSIITLKKAGFIKIQPKKNQNRYNFLFKRN
jgi:RimJ/RimL family protein N-acetyltransferase